ncbi:MAG: methylenetetrahydrofolate reductase [Planctomycetes bacterium]|nr:methylenetetrahydrofolate reductase [Planctomycetota bacterium]
MEWEPAGSTILEVVPPTLDSGLEGLYSRISRVRRLVSDGDFDAVNIPEIHDEENRNDRGARTRQHSPRRQPREMGRRIQDELGLPVIINHVVSFKPLETLLDWVRDTVAGYGIGNIVLVGAPHDRKPWPGPTVAEANAAIRKEFSAQQLKIGNSCIPGREGSPIPESVRMEEKALTGADFFTTQIIYDPAEIIELRHQMVREDSPAKNCPILVSLCPVRKHENLAFLRYLGVEIPDAFEQELLALPEADCLERSLEFLRSIQTDLIESEGDPQDVAPFGWNIAPVGQIPPFSIRDLMARLPGSVRS